jgi:H+/Cl- antiporter ClcA
VPETRNHLIDIKSVKRDRTKTRTTQGPISAIVLVMELTGFACTAVLPLLLAVTTATLIARTIEPRSIYDARLTDTQVRDRQRARNRAMEESPT